MALTAAQLLDELMGRDRNLAPNEHREEKRWDDTDVCKYSLVEFCPHELFTNTRADLGTCYKVHDVEMSREYRKSSRYQKIGYEEQFAAYCNILLSDVNKRIERGHVRLQLNKQSAEETANAIGNDAKEARDMKLSDLNDQIVALVEKTEELGSQGCVDEAQTTMLECEQLRNERNSLEANVPVIPVATNDCRMVPGSTKEMEVCTVCGALLIVNDAQQRVDEHMQGKQHVGYTMIRNYVTSHDERMGKEGRKTSTDIFNLRETERTTDTIDTNRYPKPEEKRDRGSGGGGDVRRRDRSRDRDRDNRSRRSDGSRKYESSRSHDSSRSHRHRSRSRDRNRRHDRSSRDDRRTRRSRSR